MNEAEASALLRENAELRALVSKQSEQLAKQSEQLAKLTDRVAELIAAVERKKRKPALATKPPAPATLDEEKRKRFEERPLPPAKPPVEKPEKPKAKPTGRKPVPAHLEAEEHALRPAACAHCGSSALDVAETLTEEKLHVVKEHQRRRVVQRTTCRCRDCGERTTPRSLPAPYERSKVTSTWLAWFVHQKFSMLSPLDRIRRDLAERGISLAMGTLVSFIERAADLLAPIDGLHWKELLAGRWMATDSTGLKVLIDKLPEAHNGYLELYRNREIAVFQDEATKHGEHVESKLATFRGTLTADAEHRFNSVYVDGSVIESGCNAHARRKFRDAEASQPVLTVEGGNFLGAIYGEEEAAQRAGLKGAALLAHRRERIAPLASNFETWLASVEATLLPSEPLMVAVRYYRNHSKALLRFLEDPDVPIDNSRTEREFQNVAKLRLNMLFAGSTEGAHRACVLLGILATCRAQGVPVQGYLEWAFGRLGTHRDEFGLSLSELTPAAFKSSNIASCAGSISM